MNDTANVLRARRGHRWSFGSRRPPIGGRVTRCNADRRGVALTPAPGAYSDARRRPAPLANRVDSARESTADRKRTDGAAAGGPPRLAVRKHRLADTDGKRPGPRIDTPPAGTPAPGRSLAELTRASVHQRTLETKTPDPWHLCDPFYLWPDDFRDEVLARRLELNKQRAEQERLAGSAAEGKVKKRKQRGQSDASNHKGMFRFRTGNEVGLEVRWIDRDSR